MSDGTRRRGGGGRRGGRDGGGDDGSPPEVAGRVPPHDLDAEKSVLSALLLDARAFHEVFEEVSADDFYHPSHQALYRAMVALHDDRRPVDLITLSEYLNAQKTLDAIGGPVVDSYVNRPNPQTTEDAKFSLQHLLGAVLVDGDIHYDQVDEGALEDPVYKTIRDKVTVEIDDREALPLEGTAHITVETTDGETYENERAHLRGVNEKEPLSDDEYRRLYRKYAGDLLDDDVLERTADEFLALEEQADMQPLMDRLTFRHSV